MDFSEVFKLTSGIFAFSPDGLYLATCTQFRLVIRELTSLQIHNVFNCLDSIDKIEWSSDSKLIFCALYKRSVVQIWYLDDTDWKCKIDEGSAGLIDTFWSPDSRHILTVSQFHLRVTVWSLTGKTVSYIKYPKPLKRPFEFSHDGKYLAVAERRDCQDHISVLDCENWKLIKHFKADTDDLQGILWSPDGAYLALWESSLKYKVVIYTLDGRCLASFSAYEWALGVRTVAWSPSCQFLAIGSYDQKVRVLNHLTWSCFVTLEHPLTVSPSKCVVYKEIDPQQERSHIYSAQSRYEIVTEKTDIPLSEIDPDRVDPQLGVSMIGFSHDSSFLFTVNANMPRVVWIWDMSKFQLNSVLIQSHPVRDAAWDPYENRLALCCTSNKLYMWSQAGSLAVQLPAEARLHVKRILWHPSGQCLALVGPDSVCLAFPQRMQKDIS